MNFHFATTLPQKAPVAVTLAKQNEGQLWFKAVILCSKLSFLFIVENLLEPLIWKGRDTSIKRFYCSSKIEELHPSFPATKIGW